MEEGSRKCCKFCTLRVAPVINVKYCGFGIRHGLATAIAQEHHHEPLRIWVSESGSGSGRGFGSWGYFPVAEAKIGRKSWQAQYSHYYLQQQRQENREQDQ